MFILSSVRSSVDQTISSIAVEGKFLIITAYHFVVKFKWNFLASSRAKKNLRICHIFLWLAGLCIWNHLCEASFFYWLIPVGYELLPLSIYRYWEGEKIDPKEKCPVYYFLSVNIFWKSLRDVMKVLYLESRMKIVEGQVSFWHLFYNFIWNIISISLTYNNFHVFFFLEQKNLCYLKDL